MSIRTLLLTAVFTASGAFSSHAALIVSDNFDGYANQAAFEAAWTPIGTVAPLSGELSTAQFSSPSQSIRNPGTATNSQSRNRRTFAETSTLATSGNLGIGDTLTWSFDFYDSAPTGAPQRNYANLQDSTAPGSTNQLVSMGFNNNQTGANSGGQFYMARILGYTVPTVDPDGGPNESVTGAGIYFKLNDFGVGTRSLGWHNLKVVISTDDGVSTDYEFYVDNQLAERVSNVGGAGTLRSYDNIAMGSGLSNGSTEAFFDNMVLEFTQAVPEPTSFAILLVSACGICFTTRRRSA